MRSRSRSSRPDAPDSSLKMWNSAAAEYADGLRAGKDKGRLRYEPVILELLGNVAGKRVLDAGCGEGYFARKLVDLGADVVGVDGSSELIRLAREAAQPQHEARCNFLVSDLTQPLSLPDSSFDVVLSNMVLMDLPSVDVAISESARILKPSGHLVVSITHPCFFVFDWVSDSTGEKLHKAVADYCSERQITFNFWGKTMHYHRPLSAYFAGLEAARLAVEAIRELLMADDDGVPSFLALKARPARRSRRCRAAKQSPPLST